MLIAAGLISAISILVQPGTPSIGDILEKQGEAYQKVLAVEDEEKRELRTRLAEQEEKLARLQAALGG